MTQELKEQIARNAASTWCRCFKCDKVFDELNIKCEKEKLVTCSQWYNGYRAALLALGDDRLFEGLFKPADGEDLPELEREVIILYQPYPLEGSEYAVGFGHRPDPKGWDGTNIVTGKVEHYTPKTYDKGGWNMPNIKWFLDLELPCGGRTISMNYTDKNKEQAK